MLFMNMGGFKLPLNAMGRLLSTKSTKDTKEWIRYLTL